MEIVQFEELRKKIELTKTKKARAEGVLSESLKRLESEFGCKTLEDGEKSLETLQKEIDGDEDKLTAILTEIETATEWARA